MLKFAEAECSILTTIPMIPILLAIAVLLAISAIIAIAIRLTMRQRSRAEPTLDVAEPLPVNDRYRLDNERALAGFYRDLERRSDDPASR